MPAWHGRASARASQLIPPSPPAEAPPSRLRDTTTRWRIAATLLVVAGSLGTWQITSRLRSRPPNAPVSAMATEIVTPNGARNTVTLGDGSRVTLNAGSRLRLAPDFGTRSRDVYLEGEAYFVVTHDAARPFRVHARDAIAHDLGTRFVVRAYAELPRVEVIVAEGAVSLRHDRQDALAEERSVRAYLFAAVRNRALNLRQRQSVERDWEHDEAIADVRELHQPPEPADQALERADLRARLDAALESLPERCRLVMHLRWREQMHHAEIASVMGISIKGVEIQLARGLRSIRDRLSFRASDSRVPAEGGRMRNRDRPDRGP